jgi:hypothetical protein
MIGRWRHEPPGTTTPADPTGWLDNPPLKWPGRIAGGLLLPAALLAGGIYCIAARRGLLVGRAWRVIEGGEAVALGIALIGAAIFFHSHAFWAPFGRDATVHRIGRVVGALTFIVAFWYVLWVEIVV